MSVTRPVLAGAVFTIIAAFASGPASMRSNAHLFRNERALVALNSGASLDPTNSPPVAVEDSYTLHGAFNQSAPGVLANDSDPDGQALSVRAGAINSAHGSTTMSASGAFQYVPFSGYSGPDSFTYTVCDTLGACSSAVGRLNVVNQAPTPGNDTFTIHGPTTIGAPGVLANDSDPENDTPLTITDANNRNVQQGLTLRGDGSFTITPNSGYTGPQTFTYTLSDSLGKTTVATVTLNIVNQAPTPGNDTFTIHGPTTIAAPGVLANDSDPDNDPLTITDANNRNVQQGLTLRGDGSFTITPNSGYTGLQTFTYTLSDGLGKTTVATVTLNIVNQAPTPGNDTFTIHGPTTIVAPGVLGNDSDPENDTPFTITDANTRFLQHGTLVLRADGSLTFTPSVGYSGAQSFTYTLRDNLGKTTVATVNLDIVNQAPTAGNDTFTIHGVTLIPAPGVLANDSDPENDTPFTITDASDTNIQILAHGVLNKYTNGSVRFNPTSGYTGPQTFTYTLSDSLGKTTVATVTLNIVNQAPVPVVDYYLAYGPITVAAPGPLVNDYDPDGDSISLVGFSGGGSTPHGWIGRDSTGTFTYTPTAGYTGPDSSTYQICDSVGGCSFGTMSFFVIGSPATEKAPYACACPMDPTSGASFDPNGALGATGAVTASNSGGSSGDPVNLATGRESYLPEADLNVYNPSGPGVSWRRAYIGNQALAAGAGYGSPGFTRGWVHNYDVSIQGVSGSWGTLKLLYPNGATETLTPQLDGGGQPTGVLTAVAGAPYVVSGVPGSPIGSWQLVTVTWKDQTQWRFTLLSGNAYALSQITNRTGQSLNFTWNSSRALTQISDAGTSSVLLSLSYNSKGKITTATDGYNRQVAYTFTTGGTSTPVMLQTVSQVVTSGTANPPAHWTYTYTADKGQQLNTITVPSPTGSGNSTATINYDSVGRVSSLVDANGNQRVYTYNSNTTQVQVKNSANAVAMSWTQNFNTSGLDTGITDAANHNSTVAYGDAANPLKLTAVTDRNGHTTTFTYDSFGNVRTVTTPRNVTTTYTWSYTNFALGRLTSIQEGSKPATTITYYEPSGLVQTITKPEPNNGAGTTTTTFTYDGLGNVLTIVTPGNDAATSITTTLNYTSDGGYSQAAKIGQPLTVTDNLGHVTHLRYDTQGRATSVTDALGNETDFTYNLIGQSDTTTYPATGQTGSGHSHTTNSYLYVGGPLTTTTAFDESNAQVRQVTRTYGLEGELLSVGGSTEPVTNTYDPLYRIKTLKDGNNNTTTYAYNNVGLPSSITMPGSEVTQFTSYDNAGNLLQRIDGNNVTTNYVYNDAESLLTDIQYPASTGLNVHFTYDGFGRRASMTDATGSQSYTYGNLNETLSVVTTYTGLAAKTISYAYYPDGSRQTMTTPAGTFSYSYDAGGRPASMTNPFSETTSWAYQNNNWLQTQTLANGAVATYTHNALGQMTELLNQIGSTTISDFSSIAYDGVGNRNSVTANIPGATSLSGTTGYSYDSKDQITQETSTRNGGFTDNFGYDSAGNPTSFKGITKSYNSNNQQTGTGFSHDGNGNPTNYGGSTLSFDPENRMTAYGNVLTAGYSGDGLRGWKQNSSGRTYFLYDGIVPIVEINSSDTVTATNSLGASGLVSRREGTSVFYSFDSEGNVAQRTDSTGTVLSNHLFSAHGSVLSGALNEPFGYKSQFGYYTDNETGLQLLTNRYYDPSAGRFLTRDPINYGGGINLYAYVTNRATQMVDPQGTQVRSDRNFRPGEVSKTLAGLPPAPWQPPNDVYKSALEEIGDATGSRLDKNWKLWPGDKSFREGLGNLDRMGFKPFFNPGHWGGSDWEGLIDGNWYHVIVGYPSPSSGPYRMSPCDRPPSFVDAHYEDHQPSSLRHLIDYLF